VDGLTTGSVKGGTGSGEERTREGGEKKTKSARLAEVYLHRLLAPQLPYRCAVQESKLEEFKSASGMLRGGASCVATITMVVTMAVAFIASCAASSTVTRAAAPGGVKSAQRCDRLPGLHYRATCDVCALVRASASHSVCVCVRSMCLRVCARAPYASKRAPCLYTSLCPCLGLPVGIWGFGLRV